MTTTKKFAVSAMAALLLLVALAGTASALRSLTSSKREIVLLSTALTLEGFAQVICAVALNTTLNSLSQAKRTGAIIGRVRPVVLSCQNGWSVALLNTPWNVKYVSISGTLPNITGFTDEIERTRFDVRESGFLRLHCLVTAESTGLQAVAADGRVGTLEGRPFSLRERSIEGACEGHETLSGTFSPTNGPITVTLS